MVEDIDLHECMWDQRLEDELYANNVSWDCVQYIRNIIWNWKESGEPDWLDVLIVYCFEHKIQITNEILGYLVNSSQRRLYGEYSYRTKNGGIFNILNESQKVQAMHWIMNLVEFCGLTQNEACEKAAAMINRDYPRAKLKLASSIDKNYSKWKKEHLNYIKDIKRVLKKRRDYDGWSNEEIEKFISFFDIELDPKLKGNRRD